MRGKPADALAGRYWLDTYLSPNRYRLDDRFVLIHMTGQRQSKEEFIAAVLDGTLNYYAVRHEGLPVTVRGDQGELIGRAQVTAEVFGSRRETWPLQQALVLEKVDGSWKIVQSTASAY